MHQVQRIAPARADDRHILDHLLGQHVAIVAGRAGLHCFGSSHHLHRLGELPDLERGVDGGGLSDANFILAEDRFLEALGLHFDGVHAGGDGIEGIGPALGGAHVRVAPFPRCAE